MEQGILIHDLVKQFANDQDVQQNSRKLYERNVILFIRSMQAKRKDMNNLTKSDIIEWKQLLFTDKKSTLTIDNYITSVRKFYQWLDKKGMYNDITIGIRNPKKYKGYKKDPLTVEQVNILLNSIDRTTIIGKRDYAIINLMLRTGLRTVEITRLNVCDLQRENNTYFLNIQRKGSQGNKTKIAITDKAFDPINDYLVDRIKMEDSQPLFIVESNYCKKHRIITSGLSHIIKARLRKANINTKKITAHSFRHTAAMNALKAGASLYDVQLFLGHTNSNTTQLYIKALDEEKRLNNSPGKLLDNVY